MIALALTLALGAGNPDTLVAVKIERLNLKAPSKWSVSTEEDGSKEWKQGEEASIKLSVFPVDPIRPAADCLKQIIEALKWDKPQKLMIGLQPAAKISEHAVLGPPDAGSDDAKVSTSTYVGCDGRTKWVLSFAFQTNQGARYGVVLKRVVESIKYGKK